MQYALDVTAIPSARQPSICHSSTHQKCSIRQSGAAHRVYHSPVDFNNNSVRCSFQFAFIRRSERYRNGLNVACEFRSFRWWCPCANFQLNFQRIESPLPFVDSCNSSYCFAHSIGIYSSTASAVALKVVDFSNVSIVCR